MAVSEKPVHRIAGIFRDIAAFESGVDALRDAGFAEAQISVLGSAAALQEEGAQTWMLRAARELDDAILHLRANEPELGVIVFKTSGDASLVTAHETTVLSSRDNWFARDIAAYWKRLNRARTTDRIQGRQHGRAALGERRDHPV